MLSIKKIRENKEEIISRLALRESEYNINAVLELDEKRRFFITRVEELKAEQNKSSKEIPALKKQGKSTDELMKRLKELSLNIKEDDLKINELEEEIRENLLLIPNTPLLDTPRGKDDASNAEIRKHLDVNKFNFQAKAHWELGENLDILDFERASKITGSRFLVAKKQGALLERALMNFMLDLHTKEHSYEEVQVPFIVNKNSMIGTGQLPKFEEDMFAISGREQYLIPTGEVPLTNIYSNEILDSSFLPKYHVTTSSCFRKEAGAAGRDTRGIIRLHQFQKVELVKFTRPENSYDELESLVNAAEEVLKRLELPYRLVRLCGGDLGFSSAKTYDIEVYMPSYDRYLEISSCSNFEDYQARRANIRFRDDDKKVKFVHTLNGSGLALGRTLAAVLENYQNEDGTIKIPKVLRKYMDNKELIEL